MKKHRLSFPLFLIFSALCLASCNSDDSFDNSSSTDPDTPSEKEYRVTYSYYLDECTDQIWAEINGRIGSVLPSVTTPKKDGYHFKKWATKDGDTPPATFGKDALNFFAQWEDASTKKLIGSKDSPDTVGDIIFTDGSASPYPQTLDELTEKQWKSAVAMLFTTTYNPANGSNEKGGQYQYKIAAGLVASKEKQWCTDLLYEQDDDEISEDHNYFFKYKDHHYIYNFMYVGYDWDESMDAHAAEQANSLVLGPLSLSSYYGLQNYASSPQFKILGTQDIAPAFDYAMQYGASQNMTNSYLDKWYLPSTGELKVLLQDKELLQKYLRLVAKKYIIAGQPYEMLDVISDNSVFWTSSSNGSQPYDTSIYVITCREWHPSDVPPHGRDVGYWGVENSNDGDRHNRLQVYDPCTGGIIHPMLNKTLQYKSDSRIFTSLDSADPSKAEVGGYAYVYVIYNKAYQIDGAGNLSFDTKTESHSVIPMRVFE